MVNIPICSSPFLKKCSAKKTSGFLLRVQMVASFERQPNEDLVGLSRSGVGVCVCIVLEMSTNKKKAKNDYMATKRGIGERAQN